MLKKNISSIKINTSGESGFYAVDLPGTDATLTIEDFVNKQNVIGQFALVSEGKKGVFEAVRDPLGIGKLFYTRLDNGELLFSSQWPKLLPHGRPVYAVPRGKQVRLSNDGERTLIKQLAPQTDMTRIFADAKFRTEDEFNSCTEGVLFKTALSERLEAAFQVISALETDGFTVFIALSGGLDSSIIARAAVKYLQAPIACTLDLGRSEDAEKSALITRAIGIKQIIFGTSETEILAAVDEAPLLCQDYRDFNVHCTALNILLARNIKDLARKMNVPAGKAIVLTGDTMNEFTCDYHEENVDGTIYYRLPRVDKKMLQMMLIGGLDTSDRELLPFSTYGLSCIQPFAAAYDLYSALPEYLFEIEDVKRILNGHLVPSEVLMLLPKSKLRAQVGSKESMGVLGLCHHRKITERTFLEKLLGNKDPQKHLVPITMGRYETEMFN